MHSFNQRPGAMLNGYREGDRVEISTVVIFPEADSAQSAAEEVFALLNMDNRPNGQTERSLSVGDVVKIIVPPRYPEGEGYIAWYSIENVGIRPIRQPKGA